MEIKYKYLLLISIITTIILLIIKRKTKRNKAIIIANTEYIKKDYYYKKKYKTYKLLNFIITILYIISFSCIFLLIGRLSIKDDNIYNNDINLCLDVSSNIDISNINLINSIIKEKELFKNNNYSITIFNTSQATISPLTHDYHYIKYNLNTIIKSIKVNNPDIYGEYNNNDYLLLKNFIISGTTYQYQEKGTSLIGNGLTSCINNLDLNNNNKKIILFSTDNQLSGKEDISLNEAYNIAKENNINIISIIPENINNDNKIELESISNKVYNSTDKNLIKYIKTITKSSDNNKSTDIPNITFIILFISSTLLLLLKKVIV